MIAHLIGNGNSNRFYSPNAGTVYACNWPTHEFVYDYLCMIDGLAIKWLTENGITPKLPILCTANVKNYKDKKKLDLDTRPVFTTTNRPRFNSGHHAVRYICENKDILGVHLWGIDSLFSEDLTSQMDVNVPRKNRPLLNKQWHPHWGEIVNENPKVLFTVHIPKGEKLSVKAKNMQAEYH
jgi:hypothetical protein|tara:strand:+ start:702 stop:1244 length:543 start_codon:yes stop_codon:yes gene_type:complete